MNSKSERKSVFINPRFQLIFTLFMGGISFIAILILYASHFSFFWKLKKLGMDLGLPLNSPFFEYLSRQEKMMNQITLVTSLILFCIIAIVGVLFSHRICGPLKRLEGHMSKIASGESPSPLQFRKGDFFPEISNAFNKMLNELLNKQQH